MRHSAQTAGWLILAAAATKTSAILAPFILWSASPKAAITLAMMMVPFWCLAVAGAVGLILKRTWGFYLVYGNVAVSLYGIGVPFLAGFSFFPLLEKVVHLGPLQPYLHFAFNFTVALALVWAHRNLSSDDAWLHRPQWVMAALVTGALLLAGGLWRQRFHYSNQPLVSASELPVVGSFSPALRPADRWKFVSWSTLGPMD
ncbi:MAG: hypothetical protein KIS67_06925 [Verrucomicrobiae bacterium]|nr:hypothetical protein [Verrucomicrobiae bacterium]